MKRALTLVGELMLILLVPQLVMAQWSEGQEGPLVIRGGWLFDSVSDERRPNTGIVIRDGKIGPAGPNDHADWELELRALRED